MRQIRSYVLEEGGDESVGPPIPILVLTVLNWLRNYICQGEALV